MHGRVALGAYRRVGHTADSNARYNAGVDGAETIMMLRVRERGDEVHVDIDRLAGRQQRVLLALSECQRQVSGLSLSPAACAVTVRAGADAMHIRLKGQDGLRFEATAIYRCLRNALVGAARPDQAGQPSA